MGKKIKAKDFYALGYPKSKVVSVALGSIHRHHKKRAKEDILQEAKAVLAHPLHFVEDPVWSKTAVLLHSAAPSIRKPISKGMADYRIYGESGIEMLAKHQLYQALKLPIAVQGALLPDAHSGYGLPIGGVLATDNAVIPYGVGLDIGCSMALSILDIEASYMSGKEDRFKTLLREHSKFGPKETHDKKMDAAVLEDPLFGELPLLRSLHQKAYRQLGSSGSGNHFVEFGVVELLENQPKIGLPKGKYIGLLTHSGSRSLGANIAMHYTRQAQKQQHLPKVFRHLAWLDMDSELGISYWKSMQLAGDYAAACHDNIHYRMAQQLGAKVMFAVQNKHNFAWKEQLNGQEYIVHRKGATPAAAGELGIIPGSMSSPAYIVSGKGATGSLSSASHGAGRRYSRSKARTMISRSEMRKEIKTKGIHLLGGA